MRSRIAIVSPNAADGLPADEMERREARLMSRIGADFDRRHFFPTGVTVFARPFTMEHITSVADLTLDAMRQAAAWDPDVILTLGGIEPAVAAGREILGDIPIVGTAKSTYDVATSIGGRMGLLVYEEKIIEPIMGLAKKYGVDGMVANCRAIDIPLPELYPRRPEVRERVVEVGRRLIEEDGATMLFAQGLSMVPSSMPAEELAGILGVPVLDGELSTVRAAEIVATARSAARGR